MTMGRKRKVSFLRRILEKINPSLPYEPEDPGEEVSDVEDTSSLVTRDTETPNSHGVTDLIRAAQNIIVLDENGEQVFIQDPALLNNLETASVYTTAGSTITTATGGTAQPQPERPRSTELELAQELRTAFELYSKGMNSIPCKEVGYVLRTLGQNPTEDEIVTLVCEAGCDWEGNFTCEDFLNLASSSVAQQVNRLDDVKVAFRAFDHNGDGNISREELKDAMIRFGHTFSAEECEEMFQEADLNADGKIDFDEFLQMMLPGHAHSKPYDAAETSSGTSQTPSASQGTSRKTSNAQ